MTNAKFHGLFGLPPRQSDERLTQQHMDIAASIQKATDRVTDEELPNSPRHMVKLNVSAPLYWDDFRLGVEGQYLSKRRGAIEAVDPYVLMNAQLAYHNLGVEGLTTALAIKDIFNGQHSDPGSIDHSSNIRQNGFEMFLSVSYLLDTDI